MKRILKLYKQADHQITKLGSHFILAVPRLGVVRIIFAKNWLRLFTNEHSILNNNYPKITEINPYLVRAIASLNLLYQCTRRTKP